MISASKWCIVLPPYGAARIIAQKASDALLAKVGNNSLKCFDTLTYYDAFTKLLRTPDENIAIDLLNQTLAVACLDFGTTHLLTGALSPVTLFTCNLLRKQGICTIHWFYEDYRRAVYWKDILGGYDHFCAIQKGPLPSQCEINGCRYHFLPTAASSSPSESKIHDQPIIYNVAFIGIPSPYRIHILERLHREGYTLAIAGSGWDKYHGPLESSIICKAWTDDILMQSILSKSSIGINLSVDNPLEREDVHISPRVYDILINETALLSEDIPLLYSALPGCSFTTFKNADDACLQVKNILSEPEAIQITNSSLNRMQILKNHTYASRIDELFSFIQ